MVAATSACTPANASAPESALCDRRVCASAIAGSCALHEAARCGSGPTLELLLEAEAWRFRHRRSRRLLLRGVRGACVAVTLDLREQGIDLICRRRHRDELVLVRERDRVLLPVLALELNFAVALRDDEATTPRGACGVLDENGWWRRAGNHGANTRRDRPLGKQPSFYRASLRLPVKRPMTRSSAGKTCTASRKPSSQPTVMQYAFRCGAA